MFDISDVDDFDGVCLWKYDENAFSFSKDFKCTKNTFLDYDIVRNRIHAFLNGKSDSLCAPSAANIGYGVTTIKWLKDFLLMEYERGVLVNMQPIFVIKDYIMVITDLVYAMKQEVYNVADIQEMLNNTNNIFSKLTFAIMKCNELVNRKMDTQSITQKIEMTFEVFELSICKLLAMIVDTI